MINITQKGNETFIEAIVQTLATIHLFTDDGEMAGMGYSPIQLNPSLWNNGEYPEQEWRFKVDEESPTQIVGWYIVGKEGQVVMSERFDIVDDDDFMIKRTDDRIKVTAKLSLITSSGGMQ